MRRWLGLVGGLAMLTGVAAGQVWSDRAPEDLPPVTVRWDDTDQRERFWVEGERYRCEVATHPARIVALWVDGRNLLGPGGLKLGLVDTAGAAYEPAPADSVPPWTVWRRAWVPAQDARARLNVWNSGPYYQDAHLLDIPLLNAAQRAALTPAAGPPLAAFEFERDGEGWRALQNTSLAWADGSLLITAAGDDPFCEAPALDVPGPVTVRFRLRADVGGGVALYWGTDRAPGYAGDRVQMVSVSAGAWREYQLTLPVEGRLRGLRLDPPGDHGTCAVDWLRLSAAPAWDQPAPVRGEVIFHAHPDQLRLELRCDPVEGLPAPARAALDADAPGRAVELAGRPVLLLDGAAVLGPAGGAFGEPWTAPLSGARPGAWWIVRPNPAGAPPAELFADDLEPLPDAAVTVRDGHWLGYDPPSGLYRLAAEMAPGGYGFNPAFDNPNRRIVVPVGIRSDRPRRIVVKAASGTGILPSTILTDEHGFMLPTPVLSCKNFGGELEEPDDTGYGDAYFPLELRPGEQRFQVVHLFQRWGAHLVKQVSSIRFFNIYWHLSTGVSETTCFTLPWMLLNDTFTVIPDFRPYSGPFWVGQPQHDVPSWPGLLQYAAGGERVRLLYERTRFESITPCLARFTMDYRTSDGAARGSMTAMEIPHGDEMRTFLRVRYDWDRPVTIDGDARLNFRWQNMNDRFPAEGLLWTAADGSLQRRPTSPDGPPALLGEALGGEAPVVGSFGMPGTEGSRRFGGFMLLRRFAGRLGGQAIDSAHASAQYRGRIGDYWLGAGTERLTLQPGDFLEAELMLMTHGEDVAWDLKPERERVRWGTAGPAVEVTIGRKLADFPATVEAAGEVARVRLTGGHEALPLIVRGFAAPGVPLLWQGDTWQNQQAAGGDGYQVNADGPGRYRFTFLVPLRHGMAPEVTVTRAEHTAGLAAVGDTNGRPRLFAAGDGTFSVQAPIPFTPGRNEVRRDAPLIAFRGEGRAAQAVPLGITPVGDAVTVDLARYDGGEVSLRTSGGAELSLAGLAPGGDYDVTVAGATSRRVAQGGRITLSVAGPGEVILRRAQ